MIFTAEEKIQLLNRLPALELSYEPKLHKKVYAPVYYIIPKGPKALIWYTYWKDQNICLLIKLNERGNYSDVQIFPACFTDSLALGTIIYGTYFLLHNKHQCNKHYFTCEQLYYYKGNAVAKKPYQERLNLLLELFTLHVAQVAYTPNSLVVGLPVMTETYEEAFAQLDQLPYKTYGIGAPLPDYKKEEYKQPTIRSASTVMPAALPATLPATLPAALPAALPAPINNFNKAVFKVKASLAADNYQLYTNEDHFYETAMIPTYKCSVMMNTLFRNIKENANLDLLEESDDDEDFENTQFDKFVDLAKTIVMECVYSKRFKKWQPVKIITRPTKISSLRDLPYK
jgi:hypothetical protein